ncbi:ABC transporter permease [Pararhizobium sp. BT-229]|uniref:ABC transporter permease n=1 Tax=Pararhizobium sp. BT-229 TaxID=2986923 RepID=UPI0021F78571|nr:ABC transporter permease [Pararhizobium sp. BT-229]MCV9961162.1 ABC transporter permease [Pararhizobium sp. BT-229]
MYHLTQHIRVVAALVIREMQARFGSKPGGYVWAVLDPLAHVAIMTVVFSTLARVPALGNDFALFFASGYLPFTFYQGMSSFVAGAVKSNRNLFSYPIVSPFDAAVARYILQFMTSVLVTIAVMLLCTSEGSHLHQLDLAPCVEAVAVASLMGFGMGMANISLFAAFPVYEKVFSLINRPLYLLSGVILIPDHMPAPVHDALMWNPLVHMIMWFRQGIYPEYAATGLDKLYVLECASVLLMIGICLFTASRTLREDRI